MKVLMLMVSFMLGFSAFGQKSVSENSPAPMSPMLGDWVMHIYIGPKVFHDELRLKQDKTGTITGTLTVPGVFITGINGFKFDGSGFEFQITIDEGRGPVTIIYSGILDPSRQAFSGFAVTAAGALVGGFTGQPAVFPKS